MGCSAILSASVKRDSAHPFSVDFKQTKTGWRKMKQKKRSKIICIILFVIVAGMPSSKNAPTVILSSEIEINVWTSECNRQSGC